MKNWFARKLLFFFPQSYARWRCFWDLKVDEWNPLFSKLFFQRKTFFILSHFEIMNACWTWWHELYKLFFICPCHFLSTWIMKEERGGNGCHLKWHFNTKTKLPNLFTWFDFPLFLFLTKRKSLSREIRILGFLECKQTFTNFFTDFFTISNFLAKSVFFIFW